MKLEHLEDRMYFFQTVCIFELKNTYGLSYFRKNTCVLHDHDTVEFSLPRPLLP